MENLVEEDSRLRLVFVFKSLGLVYPFEYFINLFVDHMCWIHTFGFKDVIDTFGNFFEKLGLTLFVFQDFSLFHFKFTIKLFWIVAIKREDFFPKIGVVHVKLRFSLALLG